MLADFFTKSLQGKSFYAFRDVLMGWKHINSLKHLSSSSLKERVEKSAILQDDVRNEKINKAQNVTDTVSNPINKKYTPKYTPIPSPRNKSSTSTSVTKQKNISWADVTRKITTV